MIWFGSSAGGALSNNFPEAKNALLWVRHGWHVALAYVIGFFIMLAVLDWHPDPPLRSKGSYSAPPGIRALYATPTLAFAMGQDYDAAISGRSSVPLEIASSSAD